MNKTLHVIKMDDYQVYFQELKNYPHYTSGVLTLIVNRDEWKQLGRPVTIEINIEKSGLGG